MREYMNNLTGATIVVADNVTITGKNWEEKLLEIPTKDETRQTPEDEEPQQTANTKKKDQK